MECKYCHHSFSTKTGLNNHQKKAKYCLKLRNIKVEPDNTSRHTEKISRLESEIIQLTNERDLYRSAMNYQSSKYKKIIQILEDKLKGKFEHDEVSTKTRTNNYTQADIDSFIDKFPKLLKQYINN